MPNKKILIAILLVAVITIGILVPTLILIGGPGADKTPPTIQIKSPMSATYFTQNTQVTINLSSPDKNADAFWYRIYNETGDRWVDPTNITWISSCQRTLTNGGIYTLYAWVNNTLGRVSSMKNVTFTVYELIIYSGNHTFSSDLTMKLYQKVILQNGEFAFSSGALYVSGILAMYNVTWTSDLKINGSSAVIYGNNVTFNGVADIYGTLNTSLKDTHFFALDLFDNSYCTLIDAFFTGSPSLFDNSNLNITDAVINGGLLVVNSAILRVANSTLASVSTGAFAKANLSQCTIGGVYETDFSVVTLKNCDVAVVTLRGICR